jgi:hypothetical protein
MLKIHSRAADDQDLKAFAHGQVSVGRNIMLTLIPVCALVFGAVYLIWRSVWAASVTCIVLFTASSYSNISFFRDLNRRQTQKRDANAIEVLEVSASHVVDIEFLGDDGPALCFFVGGGKALLLVGQWLLDYDSFPSESFRLHRWSDTKRPIRIETTGKPIGAEKSNVTLRRTHKYGRAELIDATPSTLQQDLDLALSGRSA